MFKCSTRGAATIVGSIASACAVSHGYDPSRTKINQGKMRSYLFNALLKILHHSQL